MKENIFHFIDNLCWNQLRIQVNNLPNNIYAEAAGNIILFSHKFLHDVKKGIISKQYFLFVFIHELVHITQQAILSLKMEKKEFINYIANNRDILEEEANKNAYLLLVSGQWEKLLFSFFSNKKGSLNLSHYQKDSTLHWMVDGLLAVVGAGEVNSESEIENRKKAINNIIQENSSDETTIDHSKANDWMDLQASAKSDGIHETYTKDAYNNLFQAPKQTFKIGNRQITVKKDPDKKDIDVYIVLTENAIPLVKIRKIIYKDLIIGSSFNDRRFMTNARFSAEYISESDTFLNSSHRGQMQFLHSMDCSDGDRKKNRKKILRWVDFCLDVFNNVEIKIDNKTNKIQEIQLNDYVNSLKQDDILKKMLGELIKPSRNTYYNDKIKDFFGDDFPFNKDPGSVALGSIAHMLQDSFALSHTKRCLDPFIICPFDVAGTQNAVYDYTNSDVKYRPITEKLLDRDKVTETPRFYELFYDRRTKDTPESQEKFRIHLAKHAMPIILFANYTTQNGDTFSGKHSKADIFVRRYNAADNKFSNFYNMTLNSSMARDCTEAFLYMAIMGYSNSEIKKFINSLYPIALENEDNRIIEKNISSGGLQYYKDPELVKDNLKETWNRYGKKLEEMMCYNTKESLSTRTLVFSYMLSELEHLINKTIDESAQSEDKKKLRYFVNEYCLKHYNEIIIDIMTTTKLLSDFIDKISSYKNNSKKTIEYKVKICQRNAQFLKNTIEKIIRFNKSLQEKKENFEISTDLYLSNIDTLQNEIDKILLYPQKKFNI